MWKVVTSSNLNPPLKLFFYSPILTNNNLLLKIYYENIVVKFLNQDFLFFILFFFLSFHFHPYIHVFSFFFFFYFFFSSTCPLSSVLSLPPSFIFFFSSRTFQTSEKRERERRKDKAGGDRGHRKDKVNAALPRPPLVLLPTTKLGQIGFLVLSFLFFSFFFFIFACSVM